MSVSDTAGAGPRRSTPAGRVSPGRAVREAAAGRRRTSGARAARLAVLVALSVGLSAARVGAQVVRGVVVSRLDGTALRGAVVLVVNGRGATEAGAFSDDTGGFALRVPADSGYALVVERIGFARVRLVGLTLRPGETLTNRVVLTPLAVTLNAVVVRGDTRCVATSAADSMVYTLWERVRAALDAVTLTGRERSYHATVSLFARTVGAHGGGRDERRWTGRVTTTDPFVSVPGDTLARYGYAHRDADSTTYYAPDAAVLVSEAFTSTHCFRVRIADAEHGGEVGLAFEPARRTDRLDVRGALWLDVRTGELRTLEFEYQATPPAAFPRGFGGHLAFHRLPGGETIVREWRLALPVQRRVMPASAYDAPEVAAARARHPGFDTREVGGEVTELSTADGRAVILGSRPSDVRP